MAKLGFTVITSEYDTEDKFELIPVSDQPMQVIESQLVRNNKDNGDILKIKFQIFEGRYNGRLIFGQYNIDNPSQEAVDIAMRELSKIAKAVGLDVFDDSELLHNRPFMGSVGIAKDKTGQYPDKNEVKGAKPYISSVHAQQAPAQRASSAVPLANRQSHSSPAASASRPVQNGASQNGAQATGARRTPF